VAAIYVSLPLAGRFSSAISCPYSLCDPSAAMYVSSEAIG